jgi:Eco47II restriction endonuclease
MSRNYLPFIDDELIQAIVMDTLNEAKSAHAKANSKFASNVIDPFSALFEMAGFDLSPEKWLQQEKNRQAQKTLSNKIGEFHQRVLGGLDNWESTGISGGIIDVVNKEMKIVAEIKNKHNTVSGPNLKGIYDQLESQVMPKGQPYKGFTAYFVQIIPKNADRFNKVYIPSDNKTGSKRSANELIRIIDGWSFYELATGKEKALELLFDVLPKLTGISSENFQPASVKQYFTAAYIKKPKTKVSTQASQ